MNPEQIKSIEDQLNASPLAQALRERDEARRERDQARLERDAALEKLANGPASAIVPASPTAACSKCRDLYLAMALRDGLCPRCSP